MALGLQQRSPEHGDRRHDARTETENSRVSSTNEPHWKWGDYLLSGGNFVFSSDGHGGTIISYNS